MTSGIDVLGERAAQALRDVAPVDAGTLLSDLHRTRRRRARGRLTAVALVAAVTAAGAVWGRAPEQPRGPVATHPALEPIAAALGGTALVVDVSRSPSGDRAAVAALRSGLPSVVAVVPVDGSTATFVWTAPTPQESGVRRLPRAAAVAWAPDESRLAIVLATHTNRTGAGDAVQLTLMTVGSDGSGRELVGPVGGCACEGTSPDVVWSSPDEVAIRVPDGSDAGTVTRRVR